MTFLLTIAATGFALAFAPKIIAILVSLLPDSQGLPVGVSEAITTAIEKVNSFSFIFPIDTLVGILQYIIVFEVSILSLKLGVWLIRTIRGTS